jgi:hypothetical protein
MTPADDLFPQSTTARLMRVAFERNPRAVASLILDCELDVRLTRGQKELLCRTAGRCR